MTQLSKIHGEVVGAVEAAAALSLGCLNGDWTRHSASEPPSPEEQEREHRAILAFLEQLRAAWDLERSGLYAANVAELRTAANPWNGK